MLLTADGVTVPWCHMLATKLTGFGEEFADVDLTAARDEGQKIAMCRLHPFSRLGE